MEHDSQNLGIAPISEDMQPALRKRRALWIGFAAVFLPLIALLVVQYVWLVDLERNSTIARQATLENYLGTIDKEVRYIYATKAERALNLPATIFSRDHFHKTGYYLKKTKVEGVKRLFVADLATEWGKIYFYNSENHSMYKPEFTAESRAVQAAVSPWQILSKKGGEIDTSKLSVDERDPRYRIILNPITDPETEKLVGLAGMIVDPDYFRCSVLPEAISYALHSMADSEDLAVTVRRGDGSLVLPEEGIEEGDDQTTKMLSFVFTDWELGLRSRAETPAQLARANFWFNVILSGVLAMVLLGGIVLALRMASREMKLSEMKSDFVSNVSHELRTPLASIRVFGEFMRLGRVKEQDKVLEYGEYIETESRRLTQLIDNILDFSKIESGRKVYQFEVGDLGEVVSDALETFEIRLRHKGFEVDFQKPLAPLPVVRMDPGAIGQAVCNLLDNAVKYSNGTHTIGVAVKKVDEEIVVSVSDHGIGISPDEQERIFDRFHRVSTGLVHDVKGSGLGLSIVQHVVQAHKGRITLDSELGEGSTFSIHIPFHRDAGSTAKEADEGGLVPDSGRQPVR